MQIQPLLNRQQIAQLALDAAKNDGYRDPLVRAIHDMRLPEDAYTCRWNVILVVTTEDGRRMLGTTQVTYLNPQAYYAQPAITIIGPAF